MRAVVGFVILICSSMLITRVASSETCPVYSVQTHDNAYEDALKNSINKFLKDLRIGLPDLNMRLENTTVLTGSHLIRPEMEKYDNPTLLLDDITVSGFSDLGVADVVVRAHGPSATFYLLLDLEIPYTSIMAKYHLTGRLRGRIYNIHGRLGTSFKNATASISLRLMLNKDREHWNLTSVMIRHQYLHTDDQNINFGHVFFDRFEDYTMKLFRSEVTKSIQPLIFQHFERIVHDSLENLLEQVPWYAIVIGKFNPDDQLYDKF